MGTRPVRPTASPGSNPEPCCLPPQSSAEAEVFGGSMRTRGPAGARCWARSPGMLHARQGQGRPTAMCQTLPSCSQHPALQMRRLRLAYLTSGWGHRALSQACLCQRPCAWSGTPATPQCLTGPLIKHWCVSASGRCAVRPWLPVLEFWILAWNRLDWKPHKPGSQEKTRPPS